MGMQDARVPVVFGRLEAAWPDDAVLFEGAARAWNGAAASFTPAIRHAPGCACCATRSEAARALTSLLHARARGSVPFFRRVLVVLESEQARAEIEIALSSDPVASSCFKLEKKDVLF
jgi:hypothetical protein